MRSLDPIDRRLRRTGGAAEPVLVEQGADVDRCAARVGVGIGEGVDEIDERLDREADLGARVPT